MLRITPLSARNLPTSPTREREILDVSCHLWPLFMYTLYKRTGRVLYSRWRTRATWATDRCVDVSQAMTASLLSQLWISMSKSETNSTASRHYWGSSISHASNFTPTPKGDCAVLFFLYVWNWQSQYVQNYNCLCRDFNTHSPLEQDFGAPFLVFHWGRLDFFPIIYFTKLSDEMVLAWNITIVHSHLTNVSPLWTCSLTLSMLLFLSSQCFLLIRPS